MVFLGLEKPVEYGAQQIFDPTMANMVLQTQKQYNDAARQEFYRGLQDIKDFQKEYGDFITPILADQDWYNKNVGGQDCNGAANGNHKLSFEDVSMF